MSAPEFDHVMYGGSDLDALTGDMEDRTGVRAVFGGRHAGAGTHNALLDLGGGGYLELIAPVPDEPAESPLAVLLAGLPAPRMILWAVRTSDVDALAGAAASRGYDPGGVVEMSRATPDGTQLSWRFTFGGADVVLGVVPFAIQWTCATHPAQAAPTGCTLTALRAEHPDPADVASALRALDVDLPLAVGPAPALIATLDTPRGPVELR